MREWNRGGGPAPLAIGRESCRPTWIFLQGPPELIVTPLPMRPVCLLSQGQFEEPNAKAYNTCTALQAAYPSCSGAVHVTGRARVQSIGRRLSLRPQTGLRSTTYSRSSGLPLIISIKELARL